jgi:hypothetical protein
MSIVINDHIWRETVSFSKSTILGLLKEGMVSDVQYQDSRKCRLFTAAQLETVKTKTNHVTVMSRGD